MHNEHHSNHINGLLIIIAILVVGIILWIAVPHAPKTTVTVTPVPSAPADENGTLYANDQYGVNLRYGDDWTLQTSDDGTYFSWDDGDGQSVPVNKLFGISLPRSFQPSTNFSEAFIALFATDDTTAVNKCTQPQNGEVTAGIRGPWSVFRLGDAGAGNYYESTIYRMAKSGSCIALQGTIHSTNIGNYDPSQGVKEFDKAAVEAKIDEVIDTVVVK